MIDFNKFGKSTTNKEQPSTTPVVPTTGVTATMPKSGKIDFNKFGKAGSAVSTVAPVEEKKPWVGEMAKSLVTAPATMLARPLQLGYELVMPGDNTAEMDKFSKEKLGGVVAPIPQNAADVKKDVGRGVQTVGLGLGPVSGGAAFGVGSSLEQGNDLFSVQTLLQGVVGATAGKVMGLVGKPLLNASGKVIGTITPQVLKDIASKGANAVTEFAARHEILPAAGKIAVGKLEKGAAAIDTGVDKLFTGGTGKIGSLISSQYPGLSKKNITNRFEKIEREALLKPTKEVNATYSKAKDVFKTAKNKGIDLGKVATDNKIYAKDLVQDGKFNTADAAEALRNETMNKGPDLLRPALKEAQPGVQMVPITDIRNSLISDIRSLSKSKITDIERENLIKRVMKDFGPGSAAEQAHPNGYSLEDLLDNKIAAGSNVKRGTWGQALSFDDTLTNAYNKQQSSVFKKLLEKTAPDEIGVPAFNRKLEERFTLADYLDELNTKKAPTTLFQGAMRTGAKVSGAALGGSTGNVFGAFGGYHAGGMAMDSFLNASNPVKTAYLKQVQATEPEIFNAIKEYIGEKQAEVILRGKTPSMLLSAPKATVAPELSKLQNQFGSVEMGYTPRPITPGQSMANDVTQNTRALRNTPQLPAPAERTIVPNTQGTPNQPGVSYGTPEVGGMRQRIFQGGGVVEPKARIDFTQPASFSKFNTPGKKFMIATTDNPLGNARSVNINAQEMTKFRKFLDDNNIHYTPQRGKYGGNPENSNIIEIDHPQQQAIIDRYLQMTNPQAENIMVRDGIAVRYDPATGEAYQVNIKGKDLNLDSGQDDFYSEVAGKKYSFPLYSDEEAPLSIIDFKKLYNK
jgi:hypothetical protein